MVLFGLTGGVASGKSTVAARFRERGVDVIDADAIARDLVRPGSAGLAEIVAAFGARVLQPDGGLDRAELGRIVFADPGSRQQLNQILHPKIRAETRRRADELVARGVVLACYEAALLVENGLVEQFRPLVVVSAPAALQVERLMARDGLSEGAARARIGAQLPLAQKIAAADYVIDTACSLAETHREADAVLEQLRSYAADLA